MAGIAFELADETDVAGDDCAGNRRWRTSLAILFLDSRRHDRPAGALLDYGNSAAVAARHRRHPIVRRSAQQWGVGNTAEHAADTKGNCRRPLARSVASPARASDRLGRIDVPGPACSTGNINP